MLKVGTGQSIETSAFELKMWKVADFEDLPDWVEEKKQAAAVKENTVSFQSQGQVR